MRFEELHNCDELCGIQFGGIGRPPTPWCKRFAQKIEYIDGDDCWWWYSAMDKRDSERNRLNFSLRSKFFAALGHPNNIDASRWIYERTFGSIHEGLQIDHTCENWRCVNPNHLEAVTNLENNRRYVKTRRTWTIRDAEGKIRGRKEAAQ